MLSLARKMLRRTTSGAIVLMYHRVAHAPSDPWDLCVSPENFESHVGAIRNEYHVIPMYRLAERIQHGESLKNMVAITFDDGYLDNFNAAKPILESLKTPACFYFTTKFQAEKKYWWDELEQLILHSPTLPDAANFTLNNKVFTFLLGEAKTLSPRIIEQNSAWRYGDDFHNARIKLYFELWAELKTMSIADQRDGLQIIKNWAGTSVVTTPPLMNAAQITELAQSGLFEIGAHTVNHPALGVLPAGDQHEEIKQSKIALENIVSQTLKGFAYPYGHYNEQTPAITKSLGFKYAVTTAERSVSHQNSLFEIPRFQVKNTDASTLLTQMKAWAKV